MSAIDAATAGPPLRRARLRVSALLRRRPWLKAQLLLLAPLGALGAFYLASLVFLFISSFWTVDSFTGEPKHIWNTDNFTQIFGSSAYRTIALRTIGIAAAVAVTDAILALPFGYFMARVAGPRMRTLLFVLVLLPLWSSTALWLSVKAGLLATGIALCLGTMAATAIHRFRFFGRESVTFMLVLPIALPGIITGMALNTFLTTARWPAIGLWTIVIGHATFCVVVVYNNVLARLRRTSTSLLEASQDLGADGWQTFRFVIWPVLSTALVAGGLLAFALSFDEVIVTTFTAGAQNTLRLTPGSCAT